MIKYIFAATLLIAYFGALVFTFIKAIDEEDWRWGIACVALLIFLFAFLMQASAKEETQGPCLKEETSMAWNAATKSNMPYTHCVDRGTWVK